MNVGSLKFMRAQVFRLFIKCFALVSIMALTTIPIVHATGASDWMSELPDEIKLSDLSIPGTHDTMILGDISSSPVGSVAGADPTRFIKSMVQTQSLTLKQQLNAGVRWIDVRYRYAADRACMKVGDEWITTPGVFHATCLWKVGGKLTGYDPESLPIYHDKWEERDKTFQGVLKTLDSWLFSHPRETIIMVHYAYDHAENKDKITPLLERYKRMYPRLYAEQINAHLLTLGDVRGKILDNNVVSSFDTDTESPVSGTGRRAYQLANLLEIEGRLWPAVKNFLYNKDIKETRVVEEGGFYMNSLYGSSYESSIIQPGLVSNIINPSFLNELRTGGITFTGIVVVDFIDPHFSKAILDLNFLVKGDVWHIGLGNVPGGYTPYRWVPTKNTWQWAGGGFTEIDVGPEGPWAINSDHEIFQWVDNNWRHRPGIKANDISVGLYGDVMALNTSGVAHIWQKAPIQRWARISERGGLTRVAVGPRWQDSYTINRENQVMRWDEEKDEWAYPPGFHIESAKDISLGPKGELYMINTKGQLFRSTHNDGKLGPIWVHDPEWNYMLVPGSMDKNRVGGGIIETQVYRRIDVGPEGPWLINQDNNIIRRKIASWGGEGHWVYRYVQGKALDIGVGPNRRPRCKATDGC